MKAFPAPGSKNNVAIDHIGSIITDDSLPTSKSREIDFSSLLYEGKYSW